MNSHLQEALIYLIKTLFGLYSFAVLLRFLFFSFGLGFYSPLGQCVLKMTNPCVTPLGRVIPLYRNLDFPSVVFLVLLKCIELFLIFLICRVGMHSLFGLSVWAIGELLQAAAHLFTLAILLIAAQSWLPSLRLPETLNTLLFRLTNPLLAQVQRWIPPLAGIDFSPLVVMVCLEFINILLLSSFTQWGKTMALLPPWAKTMSSLTSSFHL